MTEHVEEVKALPSDLVGQFTRSDIVERVEESHKVRHHEALENLDEILSSILKEIKCETELCYSNTINVLETEFIECEKLLSKIKDDNQELAKKQWKDLQSYWCAIENHFINRNNAIDSLDAETAEIESKVAEKINNHIEMTFDELEKIAFILRPGIQELLEAKCEVLSSSSLSRQRGHTASVYQLRMCNLKKHRAYHHSFKELCSKWKQLKIKVVVQEFSDALDQQRDNTKTQIESALSNLITNQTEICSRRDQALDELKKMQPPSSTKTSVYHWYNALTAILEELEALHCNCVDEVGKIQTDGINQCKDQAMKSQFQLVDQMITNENESRQIYQDEMLPLLLKIESNHERERQILQERLQIACNRQKDTMKNLFKFAQFISHVWDCHDLERSNLQQQLEDELNQVRRQHDGENKLKEMKLDSIIDKLRQESNDEGLESTMKSCLVYLDDIKKSYHGFYDAQLTIVKQLPLKMKQELKQYDEKICSAFGVDRLKKTPTRRPATSQQSCTNNESMNGKSSPTDQRLLSKASMVEQYLKTSGGTSYCLVTEPNQLAEVDRSETVLTSKTETTFITEFQDTDLVSYPYLISIALPADIYNVTKECIRTQFLNHLDTWKISLPEETKHHAESKIEEISNELDLRMYLHEPRSQRIKENIYDVRSAEILLHKNRVTQHCQAVTTSLSKLKTKFQETVISHGQQTLKLKQSIEKQESEYYDASNTHQLLKVHKIVSTKVTEYIDEISATLRSYRKDFEDQLTAIRISNNAFKKSLKVFSEGGNFSAGEIEECKRKLDRLSSKMDSSEGTLMAELESIETQRLDAANDFSNKLNERFKHHLLDLTYMEKMQRWFGNIQLKIKTEVNRSNQDTQALAKLIAGLDRQIDTFSNPNIDKETVNASNLKDTLARIISTVKERSLFLSCYRQSTCVSSTPDNPSSAAILSKQKSMSKDKSPAKKKINQQKQRDKSSRTKTNSHSENEIQKRQSSSMMIGNTGPRHISNSSLTESRSSIRESKSRDPARFDKYLAHFSSELLEPNTFSCDVREMLSEGLDNLLAVAELYYRQRGNRLSTRQDSIHELIEQCADSLVQRLQSYEMQAGNYLNNCVLELHAQVKKFGDVIMKLPHLLMNDLLTAYLQQNSKKKCQLDYQYENDMRAFQKHKMKLETLLRPTLGHPQNEKQLSELCSAADERHHKLNNVCNNYMMATKVLENDCLQKFITELHELSSTLLQQADYILIPNDIIVKVKQEIHRTEKQILRAKMTQGNTLVSTNTQEIKDSATGLTVTWPSLPAINDANESSQPILTNEPTIKTRRRTSYHEVIIKERDSIFQKILNDNRQRVNDALTKTEAHKVEEKRWYDNWQKSIARILSFY